MITKHIPNTITSLNLLSGCVAVIFALSGNFTAVVVCIALSAVFDFCDGLAARLLKAYSPMGKELDSLADLVSFGLVPALMVYYILNSMLPVEYVWLAYATLLLPVFAALRLAKFNIDDSQAVTFKGLPVPANALWWVGACALVIEHPENETYMWLLLASIPVFAFLMVSNIPMFSLKFKGFGWKGNELRYLFMAFSLALLLVFGVEAVRLIIGAYIAFSTTLAVVNRSKS